MGGNLRIEMLEKKRNAQYCIAFALILGHDYTALCERHNESRPHSMFQIAKYAAF